MEKFIVEYNLKSAPLALVWEYISTDQGLKQWFADDVTISDKLFTFVWDGYSQTARLVASRNGVYVKLRWDDAPSTTFFEMRIEKNELANHTTLTITDFAEPGEIEETKMLWNSQAETLKRRLGC